MLHDNLLHALRDIAHRLPSRLLLLAVSKLGTSGLARGSRAPYHGLATAGTETTRLSHFSHSVRRPDIRLGLARADVPGAEKPFGSLTHFIGLGQHRRRPMSCGSVDQISPG